MFSTEIDVNKHISKAWTGIKKLTTIRKSNLSDKIKEIFLQAAAMSVLLYSCTTWISTKDLEKKAGWELSKDTACCL